MNAYIFILGIYDKTEHELRFEHFVIMAESIDDAYNVGGREAKERGLIPVAENEMANDYVIQLLPE